MDKKNIFELIKMAGSGDRQAKSQIVEENLGLVWSVVIKFQNRGYEKEDLFQIGCIGLIKAIEKFDMSFDVKFSTYAIPMIIGEIKRFIRDDGIIKVSRSLKDISNKVRITREIMIKELHREPTISEISKKLDIPLEEIILAQEACCAPESLYKTVNEGVDSGMLLIDKINNKNSGYESEIVDKIALRDILRSLDKREKQIIVLRYFKEKTQIETANMVGISQVQVSRIEKKILETMRKHFNAKIV